MHLGQISSKFVLFTLLILSSGASAQTSNERLEEYIEEFWINIYSNTVIFQAVTEDTAPALYALNPGQEALVDEALLAAFVGGMLAVSADARQRMRDTFLELLSDDEIAEMIDFFEAPNGRSITFAHFSAMLEAFVDLPALEPYASIAVNSRGRLEFEERGLRYE
ncbi:MAG: hypothetical protein AAF414_08385 [Pseudomonadota bacterium]